MTFGTPSSATEPNTVSLAGSQRMAAVQSPIVSRIGEMIDLHPGTISLGQGIVDYAPPDAVGDAVVAGMRQASSHRYGHVLGNPSLLETFTAKLAVENRFELSSEQSLVATAGSNMGFLTAMLAITDPGSEVILIGPYYFNHEMAIRIADCRPVIVPATADYQLDIDAIGKAISRRTRAIVTINPNNPTGAVYPAESLAKVNDICRRHKIYHICDEAYEYFHDDPFITASIPTSTPHTISLFSLSKSFGMAGWRCGFMVVPADLLEDIKKIQDTNLICPSPLVQLAAEAALKAGRSSVQPGLDLIAQKRQLVLQCLRDVEELASVHGSQGALYTFIRVKERVSHNNTDMDLVVRLIEDFGVALMPGQAFGCLPEDAYIRLSFGALDLPTLELAIQRLMHGLRTIASE